MLHMKCLWTPCVLLATALYAAEVAFENCGGSCKLQSMQSLIAAFDKSIRPRVPAAFLRNSSPGAASHKPQAQGPRGVAEEWVQELARATPRAKGTTSAEDGRKQARRSYNRSAHIALGEKAMSHRRQWLGMNGTARGWLHDFMAEEYGMSPGDSSFEQTKKEVTSAHRLASKEAVAPARPPASGEHSG